MRVPTASPLTSAASSLAADPRDVRDAPTAALDATPSPAPQIAASFRRPPRPGRFLARDGPQVTDFVPLGRGVLHIGRAHDAQLRLDDNWVSRRHAMIVHRLSAPKVIDDRGLNGTWVNGRRVSEAELHDGDVIVVGQTVLRYVEAR